MSRVITAFSDAGQGKSTFALGRAKLGSGFKRKTAYAEFDAGSYERAAKGMKIDPELISVGRFRTPLTTLTNRGTIDTSQIGKSGEGPAKVSHRYLGWDKEWWRFCDWFIDKIEEKDEDGEYVYGTFVVDTVTKAWTFCQNAFQERLQDEVEETKERLNRLEYRECNAQMNQLMDGCKDREIDVVLLAHVGSVYRAGKLVEREIKPDGWNDGPNISDLTLHFTIRGARPIATVFKAGGADLAFVGREIETPDIDGVIRLIDCAAAIRAEEMKLPSKNEEIISLGTMLLTEV